jgi:pre-mRNA-processing factor 40
MVPEFETKEQAENAFIEFLEASGVQADWTWEQTMRVLIQFPMYRALKTTTERREAFEKFIRDKRYREVQNARETNARNREDFLSQLAECKELTQYSRFS